MVYTKNTLQEVIKELPRLLKNISLYDFNKLLVYKFDQEAKIKNWQPTQFQNTLESIWEENAKSCVLAPREHLKTATVLSYIIKKVYTRSYPLELDYFHLSGDTAEEKFRKMLRTIENNPILVASFQPEKAKSWSASGIELNDGTTIKPLSYQQGVRGKHPHIIVMDDVIDTSIMYSDLRNKKSIEKFYTDIYPMISKGGADKKIIIIGTVQRKDDLYHSLPKDFVSHTYQALLPNNQVLSPELFTFESLMQLKVNVSTLFGEKFWLKEYMNMPFEAMGMIIKPEWIKEYTQRPARFTVYQGWDLAVGKDLERGDYTSCVTLGIVGGNPVSIFVLDVFRARLDFGARLEKIKELAKLWTPVLIGIEETAFQYDTVQALQQSTILPIQGVKSIINKIQSFQVELGPYFERGQVYLHQSMQEFKQELLSLPAGQNDDMSDALKIAIKIANTQPYYGNLRDFMPKGGYTPPITAGIMGRKF